MKITRDQLHRAIAERMEPLIDLPDAFTGKFPSGFMVPKFWILTGVSRNGCSVNEWQPIDFSESEDASGRLLDAIGAKETLTITIDTNHSRGGILRVVVDIPWLSIRSVHKDRKTAVLLAAKAWLGIDGELEDGE